MALSNVTKILVAIAVVVVIAFCIVYAVNDGSNKENNKLSPDPEPDYSALYEQVSEGTARQIETNIGYSNSLWGGDIQIWSLTSNERKVLATSIADSYISSGMAYDSDQMMIDSGIYALEIERFKTSIKYSQDWIETLTQKKLDSWGADPIYKNKISFKFFNTANTGYGGGYNWRVDSSEKIDIQLLMTSYIWDLSKNKLYIHAGALWIDGDYATIKSLSGQTFNLKRGYNDLSKMSGFKSGIYEVQTGVTYGGYLLPTLNSSPAIFSGMVVFDDSGFILISRQKYNPDIPYFTSGGFGYQNMSYLNLYIIPESGQWASVNLFNLVDGLNPVIGGIISDLWSARMAAANEYY